eukprot:3079216-Pyramimonas_sp.AAC.1
MNPQKSTISLSNALLIDLLVYVQVETFDQVQARIPGRIVEKAVKGMLPKGALGRTLFTHMKVYKGSEHPHSAQEPVDITSQIDRKFTQLSPNKN